ncbi:hypothetical protein KP509_10G021500 [Ceratopteris richardii]|nr:hypothetical protein KP509_10G021500 [Ceratopteris richardii]
MRQLSRGPRYFDPPEEFCTNCGNTGHCSNECTNIVRKKACYVCGNLDHEVKDCPQSSCLICQEKGHFSRSCPNKGNENSRIWERRNFCLRCGNMGHDMSICDSEYDPEDLKGIQCYVCKDYGHLCCVDVALSSERTDTCYNCGEAGHTGVGCAKSRRNLDENRKPGNVCFKCGEEGHYARGCSKRYEDDPWDDLGTPISEMQSLTNDFQGFRSVPAAAKGHCGWQNSDAYTTPPAKWPERWNMEQGDRWSTEQVEHKNKRFKRSKYAGEISRNDSPSNWCNKNKKASWRQKAGKSYNSAGCSKRFWRKRWQNH